MSVKVSNWAWHDAPKTINGNELILLLALADVADDSGRCRYLSDDSDLTYDALAKKVRVDRRTIERLIPKLRARGLVEHSKGVKGRPNEFAILVPWARKSADTLSGNGSEAVVDSPTTVQDSPTTATGFPDNAGSHSSYRRIDVRDVTTSEARASTVGSKFAGPLCDVLVVELRRNEVKFPEPMSKRWLDSARRMVDADGRDPHQAKALIEWACRDSFWRANILSMPTFREQFDKLRLARDRAGGKKSTVDSAREAAEILRARHEQRAVQVEGLLQVTA
jgi:hypothetical protein